jgi:hypothetical protein
MAKIEPGARFGLLTVTAQRADDIRYFTCTCECGAEKPVRRDHLLTGKTISCGCERSRRSSKRAHKMHDANRSHSASNSRAYTTWCAMKQRCQNPNATGYDRYGGRGIYVCQRWQSFENFLADMGQPELGMTIERIDNDGSYTPENCRWASRGDQASNRAVNRHITWNGETMNLSQWSERTGIHRNTLEKRVDLGWPLERVFAPEKQLDLSGLALGGKANGERLMARTHCKHGHPFDSENSYFNGRQRVCRACHRAKTARQSAAKKRRFAR